MKKIPFLATIALISTSASAENWISVGKVMQVNVELYADEDSVKRTGDLSVVTIKSASFKEALDVKDQV